MENWLESGFDPTGTPWYAETGLGMGPTLLVADQREGLALVEEGAYIAVSETLSLVDLDLDAGALDNPYTAMVMASSQQVSAAQKFVRWLQSAEGRAAIAAANSELFGKVVYAPAGDS